MLEILNISYASTLTTYTATDSHFFLLIPKSFLKKSVCLLNSFYFGISHCYFYLEAFDLQNCHIICVRFVRLGANSELKIKIYFFNILNCIEMKTGLQSLNFISVFYGLIRKYYYTYT